MKTEKKQKAYCKKCKVVFRGYASKIGSPNDKKGFNCFNDNEPLYKLPTKGLYEVSNFVNVE